MSVRNRLLCALVRNDFGNPAADVWPGIKDPADRLLLAMHFIATGRPERLGEWLANGDEAVADPLARYGLFLGLTRDPDLGLRTLRVLGRLAPGRTEVWSALALLQALCGDSLAALRAAAMHAALTGADTDLILPLPAADAGPPGAIRFLPGDVGKAT